MSVRRDIEAFEVRANSYENGLRGRLHKRIIERSVDLVLSTGHEPNKALDVGCGTGYFLRTLAIRCADAGELVGVDPAAPMIDVATQLTSDPRLSYLARVGAEHLPFEDDAFDCVTAITSFDHWSDQRLGLTECARVLEPGGRLVLVDLINMLLAPTLVTTHRGKARTRRRVQRLLGATGFDDLEWHGLYSTWIKAVVARRNG
ncbi:MAG: class I SAM-dependent methyltransferase [Acidimicrobiales bacterium]